MTCSASRRRRSIVLCAGSEQKAMAEQVIRELETEERWPDPIVTEVVPLEEFHPAESEHDDYFRRNPQQPYCEVVIAPKLSKARLAFQDLYRG